MIMKRRQFVGMMGVGLAGGLARGWAQEPARRLLFGVCAELGHAEALKRIGFDFIEGGVESYLKPALSDEAFAVELEALKACALPIRSLNGFIPATFRLTGPEPTRDAALDYAGACAGAPMRRGFRLSCWAAAERESCRRAFRRTGACSSSSSSAGRSATASRSCR
jgi:hypothetical protein